MKKNNQKKGFTIVELVIVIAVIAILAAVLIPTFANVVKTAKLSADKQLVANANKVLYAEDLMDGKEDGFADVNDVVTALEANGIEASSFAETKTKGYAFYWYSTENKIILAELKAGETKESPTSVTVVSPDGIVITPAGENESLIANNTLKLIPQA